MKVRTRNVVIAIAIAMAGVVGCRYDDVENQQHEYVRDVQISRFKLGKIDFSDPDLTLIYDEGGAPFSPREILILRFADRMLQCECFHDGNRYSVPYLYLHHQCSDDEWRYVCGILNDCNMEQWSMDYRAMGVCDGTSWTIELCRKGGIWKSVYGFNAAPDNFAQFLKLKEFAMKHPAAKHAE